MNRKLLNSGFMLSTCMLINSTATAALVADGSYTLNIIDTPGVYLPNGTWLPQYGNQTNGFNSSFTFGGIPGAGSTSAMWDNDVKVFNVGSSVIDGFAGVLGLSVNSGNIAVTSFSVDTIFATAGGNFAQYANSTANMFGSVDDAGNMTFTPDGRMGQVALGQNGRWNYDDSVNNPGAGFWTSFTTGTAQSNPTTSPLTGERVVNIGDINGDLIDDYSVILVSAGNVGADWGGFNGAIYAEVWNAQIVSSVPVPAAVWLFGSGLLGLIGVARRKQK